MHATFSRSAINCALLIIWRAFRYFIKYFMYGLTVHIIYICIHVFCLAPSFIIGSHIYSILMIHFATFLLELHITLHLMILKKYKAKFNKRYKRFLCIYIYKIKAIQIRIFIVLVGGKKYVYKLLQ